MEGDVREVLLAIEQRRAIPDTINPEFKSYKGSLDLFKEVKKGVLEAKRSLGSKEFEKRYGIRISD